MAGSPSKKNFRQRAPSKGGVPSSPGVEESDDIDPDPVLEELKDKFKEHIDCIDGSLTEVVRKHEKQYLEAYNMYVKRKEVELKDLINNIYARDKNANLKDEKIATLEKQLQTMSKDAVSEDK
jgi:hypothetical protein